MFNMIIKRYHKYNQLLWNIYKIASVNSDKILDIKLFNSIHGKCD